MTKEKQFKFDKKYLRMAKIWVENSYAERRKVGCLIVKSDLMPHHIKITNIRMEQLQDISEEDCLKEGIHKVDFAFKERGGGYIVFVITMNGINSIIPHVRLLPI